MVDQCDLEIVIGCIPNVSCLFFFQAEGGIRDLTVTGVQTCALPIFASLLEARKMGIDGPPYEIMRGLARAPARAMVFRITANHGVTSDVQFSPDGKLFARSEERRVGKEGRSRGSP